MPESSRPRYFTPFSLIVAAALSAGATLALSARHPRGRAFAFEVRLAAAPAGHVQLYFDTGAGLSEAASARLPLRQSATPVTYRLPIPAGKYVGFRFDPIDHDGRVVIARPPRIVADNGQLLREIGFAELKPAHQIRALDPCGDG